MIIHKHNYLLLMILSFIVPLFSSCFTIPRTLILDPNLPPEETTMVVFQQVLCITQYNGIDVRERWYPDEKYREIKATLPAGQTTIIFNYRAETSVGNTTYRMKADDIELHFDFEAGKKYIIGFYREAGIETYFLGKLKYGVATWENSSSSNKKDNAIKSWELGEF